MEKDRDPFGQAICAVRKRVRAGRYVLGERLAITELANDLDLSATPVREALSRLSGEGLIEDRRGQGYFAWRLDVVDLTDLYELQGAYLDIALSRAGARGPGLEPSAAASAEDLFAHIVHQSHSAALTRANRLLADRLAAPRLVEVRVLSDVEGELSALLGIVAIDDLRQELAAYHERRLSSGRAIVAALRSQAGQDENIVPQ